MKIKVGEDVGARVYDVTGQVYEWKHGPKKTIHDKRWRSSFSEYLEYQQLANLLLIAAHIQNVLELDPGCGQVCNIRHPSIFNLVLITEMFLSQFSLLLIKYFSYSLSLILYIYIYSSFFKYFDIINLVNFYYVELVSLIRNSNKTCAFMITFLF